MACKIRYGDKGITASTADEQDLGSCTSMTPFSVNLHMLRVCY
jgi:hypothetical protein